jgi:hypothetical protein
MQQKVYQCVVVVLNYFACAFVFDSFSNQKNINQIQDSNEKKQSKLASNNK